MTHIPSLVRIWAALIALTGAAMLIGHVHGPERLRGWEIGLLLGLTLFKAGMVLRHYLELRSGTSWHGALNSAIALLLGVVLVLALSG